jgi:phosphoribosylformylglycinamidine cyclo-ligase
MTLSSSADTSVPEAAVPRDPRRAVRGGPLTYRDAGVDRDSKEAILDSVRGRIRSTFQRGALGAGGEFGGLFRLTGYRDPVLVSSIDGVGTKTRVAAAMGRWDVLGADIVAHGANDVLCHGAAPLFMLDYIAARSLDADAITGIIQGIVRACREQGISLLGGETAEMPGVYVKGETEVAGCTVGVVERDRLLTGEAVRPGDTIVGLASDGLHTNGYSLVWAALLPAPGIGQAVRRALKKTPRGLSEPLGDALLRPHRPYARPVLDLRGHVEIHGIAHITGGGIPGNLVRILPEGCRAAIARGRWPVPPLFALIQKRGRVAEAEMFTTFNMGLGLLVVVPAAEADAAVAHLEDAGERAWVVGRVGEGDRGVEIRE